MIFLSLGSQKFQFNRLLRHIDQLIESKIITEGVYAQIGYSEYIPKNFEYSKFMENSDFVEKIKEADMIITHGGTGVIVNSVKLGKKVIAVPRLAAFGEHVDDHQLQIVNQFAEMSFLCSCIDLEDLSEKIDEVRKSVFREYQSNTTTIIDDIESYISSISC